MRDHGSSIVRFYRLIKDARAPQRADRSAAGTLPTRAYRYCEAVTSASAFGWWLFPPMDLQLLWDGSDIFWHYDGAPDWLPLSSSAQFPHFAEAFDQAAPPTLQGCSPPFLTALPEAGTLQIWTGLIARTQPDWHLLLRAPANLPSPGGFALYEGIVETDRWFGPLFTNIRLTRSHVPIRLRADFPLVQVQPVQAATYSDTVLSAWELAPDLDGMAQVDWAAYQRTIVVPNADPNRPLGAYAVEARKRRRAAGCPFASAGA
ncbi:MAG: hypothetical protein JO227_17900 [Acetobacteraceae bacterium]|nr:hypothetical protein [Acetobacteraceae bacterium]